MTEKEMRRYRIQTPELIGGLPFPIEDDQREDEHGIYRTGIYDYQGKTIILNNEEGKWHLSVSADHTLGYYELKTIRYKFMPNDMHVAQIFPPREEFVNVHQNCFHLYEL